MTEYAFLENLSKNTQKNNYWGYCYDDERFIGLFCLEDTLVQIDKMSIKHGYDVDRILWPGKQLERAFGTRPRSEAMTMDVPSRKATWNMPDRNLQN